MCVFCLIISGCVGSSLTNADTPLETARRLAGSDKYLLHTQKSQCLDYGQNETRPPTGPQENIIVAPTRIFDNLYFIGGDRVGSWLITTSDGYLMIDAMFGDSPEKVLIPGMEELGLDPAKLKYILITHAGPDHAGGARYFQENYGTRIVMSQQDWDGVLNPQPGSWVLRAAATPKEQRPLPQREWIGPPNMDLVGIDGQTLTLGDTTVTMVFAPRRATGGGLSYIVPVKDGDQTHVWGTYGNTGAPQSASDKALHRRSIQHFITYMEEAKVDAVMSSHPFADNSVERMRELRARIPGEPHPFVIGQQNAKSYLNIMDQCTAHKLAFNL